MVIINKSGFVYANLVNYTSRILTILTVVLENKKDGVHSTPYENKFNM